MSKQKLTLEGKSLRMRSVTPTPNALSAPDYLTYLPTPAAVFSRLWRGWNRYSPTYKEPGK